MTLLISFDFLQLVFPGSFPSLSQTENLSQIESANVVVVRICLTAKCRQRPLQIGEKVKYLHVKLTGLFQPTSKLSLTILESQQPGQAVLISADEELLPAWYGSTGLQ